MSREIIVATRKVYGHGRVQIPVEIRNELKIKDGDAVAFVRDMWGEFYIRNASVMGVQRKDKRYRPTR